MKASFDGARKNLAQAYNKIAEQLNFGIPLSNIDLMKDMNDLQSAVGALLCMYDDQQSDDCHDLSNIDLITVEPKNKNTH